MFIRWIMRGKILDRNDDDDALMKLDVMLM